MNLFDILEGRMKQIFEGGSSMAPLPFKKLAKQAVREMKRNAVKMDGRTFAPTLYTVLVNPEDDAVIAPLYQQVTNELVDFVGHEAQNQGFILMAEPMVRFIAANSVKPGKMEIVAEVVTLEVLENLRNEEAAFVQSLGRSGRGTMRTPQQAPSAQPFDPAPAPQQAVPAAAPQQAAPESAPAPRPRAPRPAAGTPTCELVDRANGRTWRIGVPSTVIGRDESVADLVLNDTNVSRRHAELKREGGTWHLSDLGSTNGTRVNGLRVDEFDLATGDTVTLGLISLEFREL